MEAEDNPSNEHFLMVTRLTFLSAPACHLSQCGTFQSVKTACVLYMYNSPSLPPSLPPKPGDAATSCSDAVAREERGKQPQEVRGVMGVRGEG